MVFGDPSHIEQAITTSYVERNNATVRHLDARRNRKMYRFSKCRLVAVRRDCWVGSRSGQMARVQ